MAMDKVEVSISAKLSETFTKSFNKATTQLKAFSTALNKLSNVSSIASKLSVVKNEASAMNTAFRTTSTSVNSLGKNFSNLETKLKNSTTSITRLKKELAALQAQQAKLNLNPAGGKPNPTRPIPSSGAGSSLYADSGVALGTGVAGLFGAAAAFKDPLAFEKSLAQLTARGELNAKESKQMQGFLRTVAESSPFGSADVGDAATKLIQAGLNQGQIRDSIDSVLNFASANQTGLEFAATTLSDVSHQFDLPATEMGRVANVMSKAADLTTIDVYNMAESFKYFGTQASQLNISLEETSAFIALMGQMGIKGSMATRTVGTAFTRLADPTKEMEAAMEGAGIKAYDKSTGKFVGLQPLLAQFRVLLPELTDQAGSKLISEVFGNEAVKNMRAVLSQPEEVYLKWVDEMARATETNFIQKLAQQMQDTAGGRFKEFSSALEETFNILYFGRKDGKEGKGPLQALLNETLIALTNMILTMNKFVETSPEFFSALVGIGTLGSVGLIGLGSIGLLIGGVSGAFSQAATFAASFGTSLAPIGTFFASIGGVLQVFIGKLTFLNKIPFMTGILTFLKNPLFAKLLGGTFFMTALMALPALIGGIAQGFAAAGLTGDDFKVIMDSLTPILDLVAGAFKILNDIVKMVGYSIGITVGWVAKLIATYVKLQNTINGTNIPSTTFARDSKFLDSGGLGVSQPTGLLTSSSLGLNAAAFTSSGNSNFDVKNNITVNVNGSANKDIGSAVEEGVNKAMKNSSNQAGRQNRSRFVSR